MDIKIEFDFFFFFLDSDVHLASGDWRDVKKPLLVGNGVVGTIFNLSPKYDWGLKPDNCVGVYVQVFSWLEYKSCKSDNEPYCRGFVTTYGQDYKYSYNTKSGYSNYICVKEISIKIDK